MIHFVGAGPGAADLITMRGARLLQETDVIIYAGSLVNPALLEYAKPGCRIFNSAEMTLEEVIEVMKDAKQRSGYQSDCIRATPVCTARSGSRWTCWMNWASSMRTYPGRILIQRRGCCSERGVHSAGREPERGHHENGGKDSCAGEGKHPRVRKHDCTMVIFLSTGLLEEVSAELMEGGYAADAPAAIVYKATWPEEKVVHCTVSTLAQAAKENNITKTALILVGGFLGDKYERSKLYDPGFTTEFRQASK